MLSVLLLHRARAAARRRLRQAMTPASLDPQLQRCRICLKEGNIPIFGGSTSALADDVRAFGSIELTEEDNYPKVLCIQCKFLLDAATKFRSLAQHSDRVLRKREKSLREIEYVDTHYSYNDDNLGPVSCESPEPLTPPKRKKTLATRKSKKEKLKKIENAKFHCDRCKLDLDNAEDLYDHRRTEAHHAHPVECNICQVVVKNQYLRSHIIRFHTDVKPFVCDVCGKSFHFKGQYRIHYATHTDDLPYMCTACPYRGRFAWSLQEHTRTHTGEKPFGCLECPMKFSNRSNLNKHKVIHKTNFDYQCEQCNKGFHTLARLNKHLTIEHMGLKEHACPICDKEFAFRFQVMRHTRKVHKRKPLPRGNKPLYLKVAERMEKEAGIYEEQVVEYEQD